MAANEDEDVELDGVQDDEDGAEDEDEAQEEEQDELIEQKDVRKKKASARKKKVTSLIDDEAEESEDEDGPTTRKDGADDEDEDDKDDEYEKDDFVVSDDEEDGDDNQERIKKRRKFNRLRKKRRDELPDEDDLALIRESRETVEEREAKRVRFEEKRTRLDTKSGDDLEQRHFDGEDNEQVVQKRKEITDDSYFDDDNFDDFIEDDLGEQDALRERERSSMTRRGGRRRSAAEGISELAMQDMLEIFGRPIDDDDDDDQEYEEKQPEAPRRFFEPSLISEHFILPHDEHIRQTDVPERLQLRSPACVGRLSADFDAGLAEEVEFIKNKLDLPLGSEAGIEVVLRLINQHALEVPFIRCYRRDYLVDYPVLVDERYLWRIYELDDQFANIQKRIADARALAAAGDDALVISAVSSAAYDEHAAMDAFRFAKRFRFNQGDIDAAFMAARYRRRAASATAEPEQQLLALPRIPKKKTQPEAPLPSPEKAPKRLADDAAAIRAYVESWSLTPTQFDAALNGDDDLQAPTPLETPEYHAINFAPANADKLRAVARITAAEKLACCPALRRVVREDLRSAACVSTRPTDRGRQDIDVAHDCHGLQHLRSKDVVDLLDAASDEQAAHYARLLKARAEGLLEIALAGVETTDDNLVFSNSLTDRFNLDALVTPTIEKFLPHRFSPSRPHRSGNPEPHKNTSEAADGQVTPPDGQREAQRDGDGDVDMQPANIAKSDESTPAKVSAQPDLPTDNEASSTDKALYTTEASEGEGALSPAPPDTRESSDKLEKAYERQEGPELDTAEHVEDPELLLASWNVERELVVRLCFERYLLPQLEEELKRDLAKRAHEGIIRLAGKQFRRRIDVAPFGSFEDSGRVPRVAGASVGATMGDATHVVALNENGTVRSSEVFPGNANSRDKVHVDKFAAFLLKHRPQRIVITASSGASACRRFQYFLSQAIEGAKALGRHVFQSFAAGTVDDREDVMHAQLGGPCDESEFAAWDPRTAHAEDSLARAFSMSKRAEREFQEAAAGFRAAVSLAREAQNAVAEFSYCWLSTGSASLAAGTGSTTLLLGYDCLALKLHPLCDEVQPQTKLLHEYERHLVEVVARTGVNFELATTHDHFFGLLQFVPGLGPRKATALRLAAAAFRASSHMSSSVPSREALATLLPKPQRPKKGRNNEDSVEAEDDDGDEDAERERLAQLTSKCFLNAAGFVRFTASIIGDDEDEELFPRNPLDDTRIHPECYFNIPEANMQDWAQKMCSDALDRELLRNGRYADIVQDAMHESQTMVSKALSKAAVEFSTRQSRYASYGRDSEATPTPQEAWTPPRFSSFFYDASAEGGVGRVGNRGAKQHPDTKADDDIGDRLAELDLDGYASILEHDYNHGRRREQLEDIKRELRWPFAELRSRVWEVPDEMTAFEWFAGAPFPSSVDTRVRALRGKVCPMGIFAPRLRPRQILTVRVEGADASRLYVELSGEVAGGLRGAIDRSLLIESEEMKQAIGSGDIANVAEFRASSAVKNREAARLDDGDVFEACVVGLDPGRLRVNLSRLDADVFFPASTDEYFSHASTKDSPVDSAFDAVRAATDYVALAAGRKQQALEARNLRITSATKASSAAARGFPVVRRQRNIQHPGFRRDATSYVKAENLLAADQEGSAIVRPSASSPKLVLSWAFRLGVYKHVEIDDIEDADDDDDGRPRYDTRGVLIRRKNNKTGFKIGDGVYEDIDEILANHVEPMNAYVNDFVVHRKFDEKLVDLNAAQERLEAARTQAPHAPHYCFWINPTYAGYVVLSWLHPKSSSAKHEYIEITPTGLKLRKRMFKTVEACVDFFKRHAKEWLVNSRHRAASRDQRVIESQPAIPPPDDRRQRRLDVDAAPTPRRDNKTPIAHTTPAHRNESTTPITHHAQPVPHQQWRQADPATETVQVPSRYNAPLQPPYPSTDRQYWPQQQQHATRWPAHGPPSRPQPPVQPPELPGGRGRGRTLPAWMAAQKHSRGA